MEYLVRKLPSIDALAAIESLTSAGMADSFWIYSSDDQTIIAINSVGSITLEAEELTLLWDEKVIDTLKVTNPFGQAAELFKKVPLQNWRAFGHIAFDTVGFYLPYPLRADTPLIKFVIPQTELVITKDQTIMRTVKDMDPLINVLQNVESKSHNAPNAPVIGTEDREPYIQKVSQVISAIQTGEFTKAIIARHIIIPGTLDLFATYHSIRKHNPAARTYCFSQPELSGAGSSPELLMQTTSDGLVVTNPLAGTRKRGATMEEDAKMKQQLFDDPKEVKEHQVSVALAEQELNQVCIPGSVKVTDYMQVLPFRTVQHLSSKVMGRLIEGKTLWDALRVLFPGVTVSGIDKRSAVQKIAELEQRPRGPYAGCVGWVDSDGNSDLAIAIRSVFQNKDAVTLSAGAGIVAESVPELEYKESVHKMKTMHTQIVLKRD